MLYVLLNNTLIITTTVINTYYFTVFCLLLANTPLTPSFITTPPLFTHNIHYYYPFKNTKISISSMRLKRHKFYKKQRRNTKKSTNEKQPLLIQTPNYHTYSLLNTEEILKKEFFPINFYTTKYKNFYSKNKKYIFNFKKNVENKNLESKKLFAKTNLETKNVEFNKYSPKKNIENKYINTALSTPHITPNTSTTIFINNSYLNTKYFSPFTTWTNCIYICSKCMLNYSDEHAYQRHKNRCVKEVGKCIYKENYIKIYEIYGNKDKQYCRDLCLLGKAFLENKTLYYDVEPFVFYVLFFKENFVGYFSKEKILKNENICNSKIGKSETSESKIGKFKISKPDFNETDSNKTYSNKTDSNKTDSNETDSNKSKISELDSNESDSNETDSNKTDFNKNTQQIDFNKTSSMNFDTKVLISGKYNLSCIVVLPTFQGQGYGFMLVDLSYKLCVQEGTVGTPEKPLSEAGNACYKRYWKYIVYKNIEMCEDLVIEELAFRLGMTVDDVVYALEMLEILKKNDDGYFLEGKEIEVQKVRILNEEGFII
ncbi:MOZ/SAS-like histone acetyltransferase [Hamiltosporidium tvaerminnensis]|uniref:MOZ/SAS-like histone acetyltransferase n=1 Tax=Hamiltosporidium tvaerminnensis TaxID=1176355 RepID=A0A4Q9KXT0_9MICR|nr:MOZ/SAS-like histone acetyltransferase [Hamiltosporidium tvaerminnensis]